MAPKEGEVENARQKERDDGYKPDDESEEHPKQNRSLLSVMTC